MKPLCPGTAATLLYAFQASSQSVKSTKELIAYFDPFVESMAKRYRSEWDEDLIQEARIALVTVAGSYAKNPPDFLPYALVSIRNAMLAFNVSVSRYSNLVVDTYEWGDDDDGDSDSYYNNLGDGIDCLLTADIRIDFKHYLTSNNLSALKFSNLEIEAFELFFKHQFQVQQVSKILKVSLSKASRLISTAKTKIQKVLASYAIKNKN